MAGYRLFAGAREPMNSYTHFLGAVCSAAGLAAAALVYWLKGDSDPTALLAAAIFCCSTFALYTTSCVYHYYNGGPEALFRLRKLDHSMIYVLIAGSYTAMLMSFYPREQALLFGAVLWALALIGITVKVVWFTLPRWISTAIYLLMGWSILLDLGPLTRIPVGAVVLLAAGGVSYTAGGLIYALKKPNLFRKFGFHELFHCFVLLGSLLHYLVLVLYVLR